MSCALQAAGRTEIEPVIMRNFLILEAAKAKELLESGQVTGSIVLVSPE